MYRTIQSPLVTQLAIIIIRMIIIRPTLLLVVVIIYSQLTIKWSILSKQINFVKDWTVIVSVTGVLILVDFSGVKKWLVQTCPNVSKLVQTYHSQGDKLFLRLNCDEILWQNYDIFYVTLWDTQKPKSLYITFQSKKSFQFFFVPNQCKCECRSKTDGDY